MISEQLCLRGRSLLIDLLSTKPSKESEFVYPPFDFYFLLLMCRFRFTYDIGEWRCSGSNLLMK